jgi:hypothetical protein
MFVPNKMLTKDSSDSGDSESSVERPVKHIKVEPIRTLYGTRRLILVEAESRLLPISIWVIGTESEIMGIKVVAYNELTC